MSYRNKWLIGLNLVVLLAFVGRAVVRNEHLLATGTPVLLELTAENPRALLQGEYFRLHYVATRAVPQDAPTRGFLIVRIDSTGVGKALRVQPDLQPLAADEVALSYQLRDSRLDIGAGSYFYQQGNQAKYADAKYGGLRVGTDGRALLENLFDAGGKPLD